MNRTDSALKVILPETLKHHQADAPQDLLQTYLALPVDQRHQVFADTAQAATLVGLSRRTIQLWIEKGAIQAAPVAGKYYVFIPSLTDYLYARAMKAIG